MLYDDKGIHQEAITFVNTYAINIEVQKFIKQILIRKGGIDINTIIVGGFNIPFSIMNRLSRQKIIRDILDFNYL